MAAVCKKPQEQEEDCTERARAGTHTESVGDRERELALTGDGHPESSMLQDVLMYVKESYAKYLHAGKMPCETEG